MLQVRKSCFCGISAIYFQCCFMSEAQILMTISDFWGFFRNHFLEGGFAFQWLKKIIGWEREGGTSPMPPPTIGNPGTCNHSYSYRLVYSFYTVLPFCSLNSILLMPTPAREGLENFGISGIIFFLVKPVY